MGDLRSVNKEMSMRIIVGCEKSGVVRQAFRERGHDAWSCDTDDCTDGSPYHIKCDILEVLADGWDMGIFHPPCEYLAFSGEQWRTPGSKNYKKGHFRLRLKAHGVLRKLRNAPIDSVCVEQSHSVYLNKYEGYSDQVIQPWMFGEPFQKETHLYLRNLPPLLPTCFIPKDQVEHAAWLMPGTKDQAEKRAVTYKGIAQAMAMQWG